MKRAASQVGVTLEIEPQARPRRARIREDSPFRILVLADLGGGQDAGGARRHRIDRDDFDDVLARISPRVELGLSDDGQPAVVRFTDIDHFHPDHIRARLSLFAKLRSLRDRLNDPGTFESAARELMEPGEEPESDAALDVSEPKRAGPSGGNGGRAGGSGSLLDRMLDETVGPAPAQTPAKPAGPPRDDLAAFIRKAVAPHLVPGEDPRRGPLVERVDAAAGDLMRRVLHDPAFRTVEAAWRSIFRMVREIETSPMLTIDVVDLPRAVLDAELAPDRPVERSALHRLLVDEPSEPWSLVIGDWTFGTASEDAAVLERIAGIAEAAGSPFIAGAAASLTGCPRFEGLPDPADWATVEGEEWAALRRSPSARFVGLVLPRMLVRLPYGPDAEPVDTFEFEEPSDPPVHDDYLWGNGAWACAILLGQAFARDGADMNPGLHLELAGLPLHLVRRDGAVEAQPCAESLMSERAAARILELGLMPLASLKERDAVRLVRYQSISDPPSRLAGRWAR